MLKVKPLRNIRGFKQVELADKANITQSYLSEIETGKTKPSLDVLERLSKALGVAVGELLDDIR